MPHASRFDRFSGSLLLAAGWLLFVAAGVAVDSCRIGFFGDDFHLLDVARRYSLAESLGGAHGIWPWFRPLSRELYFELVQAFGGHQLLVAHTMSLLTCLGIVWLFWRIGRRLVRLEVAIAAIAIFLTFGFTRFVVASASGFQDLCALFWLLVAVDAHMTHRRAIAAIAIFLAPLAKETGFIGLPLLLACDRKSEPRTSARTWAIYSIAAAAALGLHLVARASWPDTPHAPLVSGWTPGTAALWRAGLHGFMAPAPRGWPSFAALIQALAALGALAGIIYLARRAAGRVPGAGGDRFLIVATLVSAAPAITGWVTGLTMPLAYHLLPAAPWLALLMARAAEKLPRPLAFAAVAVLIAWNVAAGAFVRPNLDRPEAWQAASFDWPWAVMASAEARRLGEDLRHELPARPESLVVLFLGFPAGSHFQTADGPASRIALDDPTVRAFFISSPPADLSEGRLAVLTFDPEALRLRKADWSQSEIVSRAMYAVIAGQPRLATAILELRASEDDSPFDRRYCRAAAALMAAGPDRFLEGMRAAGLRDTTGTLPLGLAASLAGRDRGLGLAMARMLASPREAAMHAALAESLIARDALPWAGLELRIASTLDPRRYQDRYRLALLSLDMGGSADGLAELERLAAVQEAGEWSDRARGLAQRVRSSEPSMP